MADDEVVEVMASVTYEARYGAPWSSASEHDKAKACDQQRAALKALEDAGWVVMPEHCPSAIRDAISERTGLSCDFAHDIYDNTIVPAAKRRTPA